MANDEKGSFGPAAVGLFALHDRQFFARLLEDPKTALSNVSRKLGLTDTDKAEVVRLILDRNKRYSVKDAQGGWQKYDVEGIWAANDWPMGWPPWGR